MRILKKRKEDIKGKTDLRKFGKDDLISNSFPYCKLLLIERNIGRWKDLLAKYRLCVEISNDDENHILRINLIEEGKHKEQAIILFITCLDAFSQFDDIKMFLYEENRLYNNLENRVFYKKNSRKNNNDEFKSIMLSTNTSPLIIDNKILNYIKQADFPVDKSSKEDQIFFTTEELQVLRKSLIEEIENKKSERFISL